MKKFDAPNTLLGELDADAAGTLVAAASDVALIVNGGGVIRAMAFGSDELSREGHDRWLGRPWAETVTAESRPKVEALLRDATNDTPTRWRHVNHPSPGGADLPVLYSTIQVGRTGRVVAIGRDLRAVAALQQRLVEAQQSMERDYARLRNAEARYRLLFRMSAEAVLIVDATTQKIMEANPAAGRLFGEATRRVVGRAFPDGFDTDGMGAVQALLTRVRAAGRPDDVHARLADGGPAVVSATLFREENIALFLVRLAPGSAGPGATPVRDARAKLLDVFDGAPDAFVVTGSDGRILAANPAFLDLAQLVTEEQARGQSLDRWLGRPGVDLDVLIANLRQHGTVRLFATTLRGDYGSSADVEISAAQVRNGGQTSLGFAIRNVGRRLTGDSRAGREIPRSVAQLTELVGRVSLKDLVRESTDMIERLCIEAALELTGDNRASAAEMLGLSRQGLYAKLHRYGLGELSPENDK